MSKSISTRVAKASDYDAVLKCLREHYYKEEPITISHPQAGHTRDDEAFTMSFLEQETILVAIDDEKGNVVGALSSGPIEPGDADLMLKEAETTETEKWRDILRLLAYIEKKANVLERFKIPKALHVHAVGVDPAYRGQKIGEKLFRACFENAKRLNFPMVTTDCTSIFSIKIAERLGMDNVSLMTYEEYNKSIGHDLFHPEEPNVEILTFIKRIE